MGSSSSALLTSLPFPSPAASPPLLSLEPNPQNPPAQLPPPFPFHSSSNTSTLPLPRHLPSSPLPKPPFSSQVLTKTDPFPFLDSEGFPISVESVICPSFAYANVFFYKPYNVQIVPREDEETLSRLSDQQKERLADGLVKRFRNAVANAGAFYEMKRRRFFENPREKKKTKSQRAAKVLKRTRIRAGKGLMKPKISIHRDPLEEKKRKARLAAKRPKRQKWKNASAKEKKESYVSDDDNWEFQDVVLPYC